MAKRRANGEGSIRKQKNTRQIIFSARNFAMDQCLLLAGPSARTVRCTGSTGSWSRRDCRRSASTI